MDSPQLARLLDLPFEVEATLPGPLLRVSQLLNLKAGSLISTSHPAGESVDVFAGNACIGSGELNVVNGRHGVRMVRFSGKS
ncbi:MAG: FliM/FliN family flagellar motor switch protein [Bryobacteraceae bacterium]|jgi:flagellar motor switch/type III secretory pathway protein FliN